MSAPRPPLVRRLIDDVADLVADRAPRLSDQAYRAATTPLHRVNPAAGARAAEARLDDVRQRVAVMAAQGRVSQAELRRIRRALARTGEDLQRLTPRLPPVRARGLALRLDGYARAVETLPGHPGPSGTSPHLSGTSPHLAGTSPHPAGTSSRPAGTSSRPAGVREALLAGALATGAWAGTLLPAAGTAVVEGGLAAGVVTAVGTAAARRRQASKERIAAAAAALEEVDEATGSPQGVDLQALDRERHALIRRALTSGRLDDAGAAALRRIGSRLDVLLVRLLEGALEADTSYLVRATVTRYLPDTLEPFLALSDPRGLVGGRPAAAVAAEQLAALDDALADAVRRPGRNDPESLLLLQGEFLRSKFGETAL